MDVIVLNLDQITETEQGFLHGEQNVVTLHTAPILGKALLVELLNVMTEENAVDFRACTNPPDHPALISTSCKSLSSSTTAASDFRRTTTKLCYKNALVVIIVIIVHILVIDTVE